MFVKPRYNKEKGVALCYSSRVVVTKNYREFRLNSTKICDLVKISLNSNYLLKLAPSFN